MEGGRGRVAQSLQLAVRLIPAEEGSGQEISSDSQVEKSCLKCALLRKVKTMNAEQKKTT